MARTKQTARMVDKCVMCQRVNVPVVRRWSPSRSQYVRCQRCETCVTERAAEYQAMLTADRQRYERMLEEAMTSRKRVRDAS